MTARTDGGFTLVEVLVALSLLAMVALISWRGLDHVAAQCARTDANAQATERILRTLAQMERDLDQRVPDALFADRYGVPAVLPYALDVAKDDNGQLQLRIFRRQPGGHQMGTVTYSVQGSRLFRHLESGVSTSGVDMVPVLEAVQRLDFRFLVEDKWLEPGLLHTVAAHAMAIEIAIERENGERYVEVLQL